jgi:hypothetical protein
MTEAALRALVRQAVAHHLQRGSSERVPEPVTVDVPAARAGHFSHALFAIPAAPGGTCVIEPNVGCNHCGFCKSYGH